jgi:ubiquinol-cytochrome c reductase cytochrome b subunit
MSLRNWLEVRLRPAASGDVAANNAWAYVLGGTLVVMLLVEAVTGAALAAFYSPSTTDAWASVAYIQDQMSAGWLIRGLHYHGASALVILCGMHLALTAVAGTYRKPRELVWWLGIVLLLLVLGFAISGYVLRWDQAGYTANRVELGIAAGTPVFGGAIRALAIGGNEYGSLTLTRFYALHIVLLPPLMAIVVVGHAWLARGHRPTRSAVHTMLAAAAALAALFFYTYSTHGADLTAPADPSTAFDARPLWYFRWLFLLRQITGSAEQFVAMTVPAVVLGFLALLPFLDRGADHSIRARKVWVGASVILFAAIALLTVISVVADRGGELGKRQDAEDMRASRLRALAVKYGVPATGPQDLKFQIPMARGRMLYAQRCSGCHDQKSKERKGPVIGPRHGDRAWYVAFLKEPSADVFWGRTKLAKTENAMKAITVPPADLDALAELLYAQSGATDVDAKKRDAGQGIFDSACTDCHEIAEGKSGQSAPGLGGVGSREYYVSFISNPKSGLHMGPDNSEMPRFDKELTLAERDAIAEYLVWLRTATPSDLALLEPL